MASRDDSATERRTLRDFWVHVNGPRAAMFQQVFGTSRVPVISPAPQFAYLPGLEQPHPVYLLDLEWVSEQDRRQALVRHIAGAFGLAVEDVERDLDRAGMPIRAEGTTLEISSPQRWVG